MQVQGVVAMVMVQEMERALRFYRDRLGFTLQDEQEQWVLFAEGVMLCVSPEPLPEVQFAFNAVLVTLVVDDVQAAYAELIQKGIAFFLSPTDAGGATIATFRDTENNFIQLIQLAY